MVERTSQAYAQARIEVQSLEELTQVCAPSATLEQY